MSSLPETTAVERSLRRTRSLTFLGAEQFNRTLRFYSAVYRELKNELYKLQAEYDQILSECLAYLRSQRNSESVREQVLLEVATSKLHSDIKTAIGQLDAQLPHSSHSCAGSRNSTKSSSRLTQVLLEHSARLATAKARLKYIKEEATLIKQEADLRASRLRLDLLREADEAKLNLEAIYDHGMSDSEQGGSYLPHRKSARNRGSYLKSEKADSVHKWLDDVSSQHTGIIDVREKPIQINLDVHEGESLHNLPLNEASAPISTDLHVHKSESLHNGRVHEASAPTSTGKYTLNPNAKPYDPTVTSNVSKADCNNNVDVNNITKFLMKKDLLTSRLTTFDDNVEFFAPWKATFCNVSMELSLTPSEELDLLIKWLGPNSSQQAKRIRASNAHDPTRGLKLVWERLDDRYARPENVESIIRQKLAAFPKLTNKDYCKLYALSDLVSEIQSLKGNERYTSLFASYDSSAGVNPIVSKLPYNIQEKWITEASNYKQKYGTAYPPLSIFAEFLKKMAKTRNDPSFVFDSKGRDHAEPLKTPAREQKQPVTARLTSVNNSEQKKGSCPFHEKLSHTLNSCRLFRSKPFKERKEYLRSQGYCFRCCSPKKHLSKKCRETVVCEVCKQTDHPSALHPDPVRTPPQRSHEGEDATETKEVSNTCTQICGVSRPTSKSCAKILPVIVYPAGLRSQARTLYCVIDDQSNRTLAVSSFFDAFHVSGSEIEYTLSTCSGRNTNTGRLAVGYVIESLDGSHSYSLPDILECNEIPQNRDEIVTPSVALNYAHLQDIAQLIPPVDETIAIELLIGRDLINAHIVSEHRIGPNGAPYAQCLPFGWVVIGNVCLGNTHKPTDVHAYKTSILSNGRPTTLEPCESILTVKDDPIFHRTSEDERVGLSIEDQAFLDIMTSGFYMREDGKWTAPLPFRSVRPSLNNNRDMALKRARSFDASLRANPVKAAHVRDFIQKIFDSKHAEQAPDMQPTKECWYLPLFSVYHPKKPDNVRVVFDSSARFQGTSLNDVLLKGPPSCNSLLGILLRFRKESVAVTVDVEQMFHNFKVNEDHRDYLRFLWHQDNNLSKPLTDHRMTVHVFGNSTSPAVATYGIRKSVETADPDVRELVVRNFYVDDGLVSCESPEVAIYLIKRAQCSLYANGRLRLHKVASNNRVVLDAFPQDDLASNLKELDIGSDELPLQRSLGLLWDTDNDHFTFKTSRNNKSFTKRGILSVINSIFDPIGFASPVVITGRLIMRDIMSTLQGNDWDEPLPDMYKDRWTAWVDTLSDLEYLKIPRQYNGQGYNQALNREVHIFSDASKDAISAVAYLKLDNSMSFLLGKAKVAPSRSHTIPRMELCASVLAIDLADIIKEHLDITDDAIRYYTDSKVVLGYISNDTRRFYVYVQNRVNRIRSSSTPSQWRFIPTNQNPADLATRPMHASKLQNSAWLTGPKALSEESLEISHPLIDPSSDQEIRPDVVCNKTSACRIPTIGSDRFSRFSTWKSLVRAITFLKRVCKTRKGLQDEQSSCEQRKDAENFILQVIQSEAYGDEISSIQEGKLPPSGSSLRPLNPILGSDSLLRVGGRLGKVKNPAIVDDLTKHPIIIPKHHHIAVLLIRHFHQRNSHQGRHMTEGAIRAAGFWVVGSKQLVSSEIRRCTTCRKLRGRLCWQQMAELPEDRLQPGPAFTYVGVDTFGPWPITYRRSRGAPISQKRWAVIFTCLVSRAAHIEVVEELSASSFINALRRFIAIRGPVKQFRSDRGTNFIGAVNELNLDAQFAEDGPLGAYLRDNNITWIFNPPHASHFGGVWERAIGSCRRILDSLLLNTKVSITHEVLTTLMMEVCAIMNARPLTEVSTDPENPQILSPSQILTQKSNDCPSYLPTCGFKDAIKGVWKRVQYLAEEFWNRWRSEYVQHLQLRQKWEAGGISLKKGDVVLLKDDSCARNLWPVAIVTDTYPSDDDKVRKVKVMRGDNRASFIRPISQLVLLLEVD